MICVFSSVLQTSIFLHCEACAAEISPDPHSWTSLKRHFFSRKKGMILSCNPDCISVWKLGPISILHALTPTTAETICVSSGQIRVSGSFAWLLFWEPLTTTGFCSLLSTKLHLHVWPCWPLSERCCHLSMPLTLYFWMFCCELVSELVLLLPRDLCSWNGWHRQMSVTCALGKRQASQARSDQSA